MSVSVDWKPGRAVQEKLETLNKNSHPDRLKNPQGQSMQKLRIKRQSNCIWSGTINLGHPVMRRPPIRSICKWKTRNKGNSKLLGRIMVTVFNIPFPYFTIFQILWSRAIGGSQLNSSNLSMCPFIWNSHLFYLQNFFNFWWQYLKQFFSKLQNFFFTSFEKCEQQTHCNALFIYLIILLENIVYYYILYDFWWLCDV